MGRLPLGPENPDDAVVAEVFDGFTREGRKPIALYRVLAHAPNMLRAFSGVGRGLRHEAKTPRVLRELIVLRVAQLTHSNYEWSHHKSMALEAGATAEQLRDLAQWQTSSAFDARERAVLRCTEEIHTIALSNESFDELRLHFEPAEIVEIVLMASHYQAVARVIQGLDVDVEPAYEAYLDDSPLGHP